MFRIALLTSNMSVILLVPLPCNINTNWGMSKRSPWVSYLAPAPPPPALGIGMLSLTSGTRTFDLPPSTPPCSTPLPPYRPPLYQARPPALALHPLPDNHVAFFKPLFNSLISISAKHEFIIFRYLNLFPFLHSHVN